MRILAIHLGIPHEPDLSWLLNKSAAAAGIRSSFGVLADAAAGGWGGGRQDPHASRVRTSNDGKRSPWLDDVGRERVLHARWESLPCRIRRVLASAYTEKATAPQTDGKLGALANVAPLTAAFRELYEPWAMTQAEFLVALCTASKRSGVVDVMRIQSSAMVEVAAYAWRMTRDGAKSHPPSEETLARAEAAWRHVELPRRHEAPRTWAPMVDETAAAWESPREAERANARQTWAGTMFEYEPGECL